MNTNKNTTIAKRFEHMASRLNRDEYGFVMGDYRPLMNMIRREAVGGRLPLGVGSIDPTVEYVYLDGSVLRVDNPAQEAFPLRISESITF